jgi:hypothetical protein
MEDKSVHTLFDKMTRRDLLARTTALIGGTLAGFALQPGSALGQEKVKTSDAGSKDEVGNVKPAEGPNLHPPVAQTKCGRLGGFRDGTTYSFLGIPYAEAERFELPKAVKPWDGIKNAQVWGYVCPYPAFPHWPSPHAFAMPNRYWPENEHCQVLNIWTQSLGSKVKKPVMVWLHGGGFTYGSSMDS